MTGDRGWRWIAASVLGTSHSEIGLPCQDASVGRVVAPDTIVLIAADGAGSAAHADVGARVACELMIEQVAGVLSISDVAALHRNDAIVWLADLVSVLQSHADENGSTLRDHACTLLLAVVGAEAAAFFQLGDGAIVIRDQDPFRPVFWPQSGEYANTTYFVTDQDAAERLQFCSISGPIYDVAVFTDGLQSLSLQFAERVVHAPFFNPMFDRLRKEPPGEAEELAGQLRAFLNSERVNARTDDDKTLLLASRPFAPDPDGDDPV